MADVVNASYALQFHAPSLRQQRPEQIAVFAHPLRHVADDRNPTSGSPSTTSSQVTGVETVAFGVGRTE